MEPTSTVSGSARPVCTTARGCSAMRELFEWLDRAAKSDATLLIEGETGTGKELVATAVHEASARGHQPLSIIDCGALTASLLEAELFGHARGAFTGAHAARAGAIGEPSTCASSARPTATSARW